jgi:two-component system, LytTR family, sensor kinase
MSRSRNLLRSLLAIFAAWTAFGLLSAGQVKLLLAVRGEERALWSVLGPSLVGAWIWACYTPVVIAISRRIRGARERLSSRTLGWALYVGAHLVVMSIGIVLDTIVWASVRPLIDGVVLPLDRVFASTLIINVGSYLAVVTLSEARDYAARWRERDRAATILERTAESLRQKLDDAKLRALESQLQPHFLYNTLNLVAELVHQEPDVADEMLTHLGTLLRRSYLESSHLVPLAEEIDFVRAYGEILERRYRDRVRLVITLPHDLAGCLVPAFLLQPLVENAFRHGVERRERGSVVEITSRAHDGMLQIRVRDRAADVPRERLLPNGARLAGQTALDESCTGIGLRNTRERLAVLYGAAAGITLVQMPHETVASVWLPLDSATTPSLPGLQMVNT